MPVSARLGPRKPKPSRAANRTDRKPRANARLGKDIAGIVLVALGLIALGSLADPSSRDGGNLFGRALVSGLRFFFGVGAWLFPFLLIAVGSGLATGRGKVVRFAPPIVACAAFFLAWWHLGNVRPDVFFVPDNLRAFGGILGAAPTWALWSVVGVFGAHIVYGVVAVVVALLLVDVPLPAALAPLGAVVKRFAGLADAFKERRAARTPEVDSPTQSPRPTVEEKPVPKRRGLLGGRTEPPFEAEPQAHETPMVGFEGEEVEPADPPTAPAPDPRPANASPRQGAFVLPPPSLLVAPKPVANPQANASAARRETILQTLEDFGIGADVSNVSYGPTITRYEIALERGIKVNKIVSLADNLAMAMAAIDVRVEAPIPGKSAIGLEVPNEVPQVVTLRECLESNEFRNAPGKLTFVLGRDVTGAVRVADLAKMPHLLVGGSTGSGKSVGLNTLISSLLYRNTPRDLKLLMIDPKKVELSLYEGIPHLAAPVITNVKQAPSIFKQAIKEMELRYDKFAKAQTRNIEGFNAKVDDAERLPYWVIVVDELADLMMTSGPEIETGICRLAQLSRATGIHLVIATQRPSVNVITGTIKANISSRIAFAVNSAIDSRTILDQMGADRLIGRGDMLFLPMDAPKPQRIQGCFVSEQETERLVNFLKEQGNPHFDVIPTASTSATGEDDSGEMESEDDLFEAAVRLVVTGGSASTSMLQRRFKIGYTRAARLVDLMEQRGIVGQLDGAKPREILISRDQMEEMFDRTPVSD